MFRMFLIFPSIGMYVLTNQSNIPTTISTITMFKSSISINIKDSHKDEKVAKMITYRTLEISYIIHTCEQEILLSREII